MNRRQVMAGMGAAVIAGQGHGATGYVVPAEDVAQARSFMQWPVSRRVYGNGPLLGRVQRTIARIAGAIADFHEVVMLADRADHAQARAMLPGQVALWDIPTEDLWCRDSGPIFAVNGAGGLAVPHIHFNGWGGKQVHRRDGQIAARVAQRLGLPLIPSPLQGEAGGVEQDGHGLLMAHESSWLTRSRNPGMSRDAVEAALLSAYGATRMIWAPGLRGQDITDYHIDSLARFTGPGRVLMNLPDAPDPRDPFHRAALETHDILQAAGLEIEVIPEPVRPRVCSADFVASYANFLVCNGAVISAEFGDPETDTLAADALARHFPGRAVVQLNVDALGEIGGGIHCATREMPAT